MPRRDDAQLTTRVDASPVLPVVTAGIITAPVDTTALVSASIAPPANGCTCEDFRRNQVCDHVLMAAAVRMVRRMIDIHSEPDKPH